MPVARCVTWALVPNYVSVRSPAYDYFVLRAILPVLEVAYIHILFVQQKRRKSKKICIGIWKHNQDILIAYVNFTARQIKEKREVWERGAVCFAILPFVCFWAIPLSSGKAKSNLLSLTLLLKPNIMLWLMLPQKLCGFAGFYRRWASLFLSYASFLW